MNVKNQASWVIGSIGFGLSTAIASMTNWGRAYFFSSTSTIDYSSTYSSVYMIASLCLLAFAFFWGCAQPTNAMKKLSISCGPFMFVGSIFALITPLFPGLITITPYLSAVLLGIGVLSILCCWIAVFATQGLALGAREMLMGYILSGLLRLCLEFIPEAAVTIIMTFVAIPFAWISLMRTMRNFDYAQSMWSENIFQQGSTYQHVFGVSWRTVLYCSAIALVCGVIRALAVISGSSMTLLNYVSMGGIIVGALVILQIWRHATFRLSMFHVFRVVFPVLLVCIAVLPFVGSDALLLVAMLFYMVHSFVSIFLGIYTVQATHNYGINPLALYSASLLFTVLFNTMGYRLGYWAMSLETAASSGIVYVALALLAILASILYLTHGMSLRYNNEDEIALEFIKVGFFNENSFPENDEDVYESYVEDRSINIVQEMRVQEATKYRDRISKRCVFLADKFGLSTREKEVLELAARGNSISTIAKELFVSENTAKTHLKRIYMKLGIHKRQDLLDLLEMEFDTTSVNSSDN